MSRINEMALELGQSLGRTDEYQALKRASDALADDREMAELRTELEKLEGAMMTLLRSGQEPDEESRERYEALARDLQSRAAYQRLVAAQSNFDKLLQKVNDAISRGIQEGGESRIVLAR